MKFVLKYICIFFTVLFASVLGEQESFAQKTDAFARVSVTPREGVVRQPYKVTITVHSSTWFAKPLQFANLRIDDAFIIPFTRTVSSINYINKKKYATLSFYYLVFPYNTGTLEIPELEISASIPPEGGYKGEAVTILTKAQTIQIKPIPSAKDEEVWMVAKNVAIKESWSKPLNNLKVGDVIEREITITASGTLPSLIEPFKIEQPDLTSIYPKEPDLQDKRNNDDVNGVRIESYSYLFEEEGEIIIPEEEIFWWNPTTKRVYKRTIEEQKLTIATNPDLTLMKSLKDSLLAMSAPVDLELEEKSFPWLRVGIVLIVLLLVGYFGTKITRYFILKSKTKRSKYLQSEAYYFKKLNKALNDKNTTEFIRQLYVWFDKARKSEQNAAIYYYLSEEEKSLLESVIRNSYSVLSVDQKNKFRQLLDKLKTELSLDSNRDGIQQLNPV
jgi:hypothetical protein